MQGFQGGKTPLSTKDDDTTAGYKRETCNMKNSLAKILEMPSRSVLKAVYFRFMMIEWL
jgi:hypothetical protein